MDVRDDDRADAPLTSPLPAEPAGARVAPEPAPHAAVSAVPPAAPLQPRVRPRHHPLVRITHWAAFPLVFLMISSGLQIYRAYPRFGDRGEFLYPNPFQDVAFPLWSRLGGWLAGGINWHFMLMWPLIIVGVMYFAYMLSSGEWRKLVFRPRDVRPALEMMRYYLHIRRDHPPQGKHNALQKAAYTFIVLLGVLSVVSGFAVWKSVQLSWLTAAMGGFQAARYWHFWAVWLFVGFTVAHVILVFVVDPSSFRAMTTGGYRGRFTSDDV
jgi:thiosulfate reductase cytochrome b subunit